MQTSELDGHMRGETTDIPWVFKSGTNLHHSPQDTIWLLFYYLWGEDADSEVSTGPSHYISLYHILLGSDVEIVLTTMYVQFKHIVKNQKSDYKVGPWALAEPLWNKA